MIGVSYAELWSSGIDLIEMASVFLGAKLGLFSVANFQEKNSFFC
jgi:hypothetical protein